MSSAGVDAGVVPPGTGTSPLRWSLPPAVGTPGLRNGRQRYAGVPGRECVGLPGLSAPLGTRSLRTHYFAPDGRQRPGETPVRTALSPRLLIRMRSQVQVLAGPLPIPAGPGLAAGYLRCGRLRVCPLRATHVPLATRDGTFCGRLPPTPVPLAPASAVTGTPPGVPQRTVPAAPKPRSGHPC
jgi:hypothetical protein